MSPPICALATREAHEGKGGEGRASSPSSPSPSPSPSLPPPPTQHCKHIQYRPTNTDLYIFTPNRRRSLKSLEESSIKVSFIQLLPRLPSSFPSCVQSSLDPNISHSSLKAVDNSLPWPHSPPHLHVRESVELAPIPQLLASNISLSTSQHPPFVAP